MPKPASPRSKRRPEVQAQLDALGEAFKSIRESKGMSQDRVAKNCEKDRNYISLIENGTKDVQFTSLMEAIRGLGVEPVEVIKKYQSLID